MNNALLDQANFISKPSVLSYDSSQRQRLFDLWEILMNPFRAYDIAKRVEVFAALEVHFNQDLHKDALKPYADKFEQNLKYSIAEALGAVMPNAAEILQRVLKAVVANKHDLSRLRGELAHAKHALLDELQKRKFLYVNPSLTDHVEQKDLFGASVFREFPEARFDIRESGNCLAADCNTAAVFHLIRVAEFGLRKIATKLDVEIKDKGNTIPLEHGDWNKIITGIRNKIRDLRTISQSEGKELSLRLYSDVTDQAEYFKDIWRNSISHTRRTFNENEALGVKQRVNDFMKRVAELGSVV